MEEANEPRAVVVRPYLVILRLDEPRAEHKFLRDDLDAYSTTRPMMVCVGTGVVAYFIASHLAPHQMAFEGHLLGRDSRLVVELGGTHGAEGFLTRELSAWLGSHLYR